MTRKTNVLLRSVGIPCRHPTAYNVPMVGGVGARLGKVENAVRDRLRKMAEIANPSIG